VYHLALGAADDVGHLPRVRVQRDEPVPGSRIDGGEEEWLAVGQSHAHSWRSWVLANSWISATSVRAHAYSAVDGSAGIRVVTVGPGATSETA
jgi:hypothetical protein